MNVLGFESSCDETGVALVQTRAGGLPRLLAQALHTQVAMHAAFGGVVPELASRDHVQRVLPLTRQVLAEAGGKDRPVVLMCRSGQRTIDAGLALEAAGFTDVSHVVHGFEGDLDARFQRSSVNGWRHEGLPWEQM
jgi:N6-L-threonylcarbamoyladenine synthase